MDGANQLCRTLHHAPNPFGFVIASSGFTHTRCPHGAADKGSLFGYGRNSAAATACPARNRPEILSGASLLEFVKKAAFEPHLTLKGNNSRDRVIPLRTPDAGGDYVAGTG
jgi:hypothetical protein